MSSSIYLYQIPGNITADTFASAEVIFDKSKSANLYKIAEHLAIVFMNTTDPFSDDTALPYKVLYGNFIDIPKGDRIFNGFISPEEVNTICNWIRENNLLSAEGFYKLHDDLSEEARKELYERGSDEKENLYSGYVQPLVQFYADALKNKSAIALCGE